MLTLLDGFTLVARRSRVLEDIGGAGARGTTEEVGGAASLTGNTQPVVACHRVGNGL